MNNSNPSTPSTPSPGRNEQNAHPWCLYTSGFTPDWQDACNNIDEWSQENIIGPYLGIGPGEYKTFDKPEVELNVGVYNYRDHGRDAYRTYLQRNRETGTTRGVSIFNPENLGAARTNFYKHFSDTPTNQAELINILTNLSRNTPSTKQWSDTVTKLREIDQAIHARQVELAELKNQKMNLLIKLS